MRLSLPAEVRWTLLPPVLRVAAEAGIFTVVYAAAAVVIEHQPPLLGPIELGLLVAGGALVARVARPLPEIGALLLIAAVLAGGAAGWLASPAARAVLLSDPATALATHGTGWLAAFAVLRGLTVGGATSTARQLEQLLRSMLPILALIWAVTTLVALPVLWLSFAASALWGTVVLLVAGLSGLGMDRLQALHAGVTESRVRRVWRWLVLAAAISVVPLAVPFVVLAGIPVDLLFGPIIGPVLFLIGLVAYPLAFIVDALVVLLKPFAGPLGLFLDEMQARLGKPRPPEEVIEPSLLTTIIGLSLALITVLVLAGAAFAIAHWLLSRREDELSERGAVDGRIEHSFVVPVAAPRAPRPATGRRRRRDAARDAVGAYVSAIDELSALPIYARQPSETPAQHALRLRATLMPAAPELGRLAADYQLARYAERDLTDAEDRRALARLDRLRRLLRGS